MNSTKTTSTAAEHLARRIPSLIAAWRAASPASRRPRLGGAALSPSEVRDAAASLLRLQRGLTGARELAGSGYMEHQALLGAYLLYYWPVSYIEVSLILEELRPLLPRHPWRILDLGCGPGPGAAALLDAGADELDLVDSGAQALELAKALLESRPAGPADGPVRTTYHRQDLAIDAQLPAGPYDVILLAHTLNELWKDESDRHARRLAVLERLAGLLALDGLLVVVEPALLATGRETLALRDDLAAAGYEVAAPCPGSYPCPALAAGPSRTCHLDTAWAPPEPVASLAAAAGLDRQSVKCSWFALRSDAARRRSAADFAATDSPSNQAPTRTQSAPAAASRRGRLAGARVVSEALLNKAGRLRIFLCADGQLTGLSAARGDRRAEELGFFSLRRGDVVTVEGAEPRPGGLGIGPDTALTLDRSAPRPEGTKTAARRRPDAGEDTRAR
ncbi:MAG: methyltransferase domain-containing protein [Treponema sp.]|nr:methyltransferase domain-containing protein [Treponema sp.]